MNIDLRLLCDLRSYWKLLAGSLGFSVLMAGMEMVPAALTKFLRMRRRLADMDSILSHTIGGIRVVQIFGQEEHEAEKIRRKSREFASAGNSTQFLPALFMSSVALAFGIGQVAVWFIGGREVIENRLTRGELVMFSGYVAQFYAPLRPVRDNIA